MALGRNLRHQPSLACPCSPRAWPKQPSELAHGRRGGQTARVGPNPSSSRVLHGVLSHSQFFPNIREFELDSRQNQLESVYATTWSKTPINTDRVRSNFIRKNWNPSRQGRSSCMLIRHSSSWLELRRRTMTSQWSFSTKFGGRRTAKATPRHRWNLAEPLRRRCLPAQETKLVRFVVVRSSFCPNPHWEPCPRAPFATLTGEPPPWVHAAAACHPSLDQWPRLDHRIPLGFIKI
jgi:hypothetical protein